MVENEAGADCAVEQVSFEKGSHVGRDSRAFAHQLLKALEEERKRISRELHDDTQQALTSIILRLDMLKELIAADQEPALKAVDGLKALAESALETVHTLALNLRPAMLDDLGLIPTVRWYINRCYKDTNLSVTLTVNGEVRKLPPDVEIVTLRIIQEALVNVVKHSGATVALVELTFGDSGVTVLVEDNGNGFSIKKALADSVNHEALGLMDMRERSEIVGGSLSLESEFGRGTKVRVAIPLEESP